MKTDHDLWRYSDWRPGGERTAFGDLTFDSTIPCGNGHDFRQVGPCHYRFRARPGLVTYAWRFLLRLESPGEGREIILEVADFNHFGQELWQEQAAVVSRDGQEWRDLGLENIRLVPWTPTGDPAGDESIDDGWHPPYGVQHRLKLDDPILWFATGTPYTLQHSREHQQGLAQRARFFQVQTIGRTAYADQHGHPLLMTKVSKGDEAGKLRVMVVAGEHPSEFAGMYAAEGLLEELLRRSDLLGDFSFWVVPVVNVDGVAYGRSYHNLDADDPVGRGVNVGRDWRERSQPETRAVWQIIEQVRPHCLVSLHNGRHRRMYEAYAAPHAAVAPVMRALRKHLPLPLEHWRPITEAGSLCSEAQEAQLAESALLIETLILQKLPGCDTFKESYRRAGQMILRGLVEGLREVYGRPQMLALAEPLGRQPLRLGPRDFLAQLPWFHYGHDTDTPREHNTWNLEINGLPLEPGHYDLWLHQPPGSPPLGVVGGKRVWPGEDGWALLPSLPVPARLLSLEFEHEGGAPLFDDAVVAPEGTPLRAALSHARHFARYVRNTRADEKRTLRDWQPFHDHLQSDDFGGADLAAMAREIVDFAARRQVLDPADHHHGAVWSEEDKYDARDAAAAVACFTRRYRQTGEPAWLERSLAARRYVYRNQRHEPGNANHDGGFVHMVRGMWGVDFTRLYPPYPGIDGVDTGVIVHQLCAAAELGLPLGEEDGAVLRHAADWIAANEPLPGVFLHHEGATHDCQNANAIGFSALLRAYHTLARAGANPPVAWLAAVERGVTHYLQGQEAIGVWPYWFAQVGRRAGAYSFDNIPDHGIGLYHLTRVLDLAPLRGWPGLPEALRRAACWYLCVSHLEPGASDPTINLEYDQYEPLGDDICFSGFTWCRFTAAATLLRIARCSCAPEPWRHLALRLMEHVRRRLWQTADASLAPVVAHARPEARLATWCQAAEWDAAMLGEMIDDLQAMASGLQRQR